MKMPFYPEMAKPTCAGRLGTISYDILTNPFS